LECQDPEFRNVYAKKHSCNRHEVELQGTPASAGQFCMHALCKPKTVEKHMERDRLEHICTFGKEIFHETLQYGLANVEIDSDGTQVQVWARNIVEHPSCCRM
jgi:hypothetical protein